MSSNLLVAALTVVLPTVIQQWAFAHGLQPVRLVAAWLVGAAGLGLALRVLEGSRAGPYPGSADMRTTAVVAAFVVASVPLGVLLWLWRRRGGTPLPWPGLLLLNWVVAALGGGAGLLATIFAGLGNIH